MRSVASLDSCFAKLARAEEHLELFREEADRLLDSVAASTTFKTTYDPDVPRFLVSVDDEPTVSLRLCTIAGDYVHNLRSSLDHLAFQLLILVGDPYEKTQWPIVGDLAKIDRNPYFRAFRDRLRGKGRGDLWTKVEGYQHHNYVPTPPTPEIDLLTQRYRDLPLLVLHELSNMDKHRLLLDPYFTIENFTRITPRCIRDCENPRLIEDWGLWYTLRNDAPPIAQYTADITGNNPEMQVDIEFSPRPVRFAEIPDAADTYLVLMAHAVRVVLDDFAQDF